MSKVNYGLSLPSDTWWGGSSIVENQTTWLHHVQLLSSGNGFIGQNKGILCCYIVMDKFEGEPDPAYPPWKIVNNYPRYWWVLAMQAECLPNRSQYFLPQPLPQPLGATCPNKTNKSGGPKDVADAWLPPPSLTKMLSLSEWREWMGQWVGTGQGSRRGAATLTHSQYHVTDHTKLRSHDQSN